MQVYLPETITVVKFHFQLVIGSHARMVALVQTMMLVDTLVIVSMATLEQTVKRKYHVSVS